jgi:ADP-ribosylglycohydrolase
MTSTQQRVDRARGVLLAAACGDALGVPYEFGPPIGAGAVPRMIGGGLGRYQPGEYSDDTQTHVVVANVAASGADLRTDDGLRSLARGLLAWMDDRPTDIGAHTFAVLQAALGGLDPLASMRRAAQAVHDHTGESAGPGSLARTAVLALAYLDDREALAAAARAVSALTHVDPLAGDACVLWCEAVRRAVLDATFDGLYDALDLLEPRRASRWEAWLDEAGAKPPEAFAPNSYVVRAVQTAWSAIVHAPGADEPQGDHLGVALYEAIRAGDDTDTVAAIAGALLGARWGVGAVYRDWLQEVHGWPHFSAINLIGLADEIVGHHGGMPEP